MKPYFISPLILQSLLWPPARLLLRMFARFEISGLENLKGAQAPFIFAPNHASELDVIAVRTALPLFSRSGPMFYTTLPSQYYKNAEIFGWRRFIYSGFIFKSFGAYPLETGCKDYSKSLANQEAILRDGGSVCIFPEGGMTKDGSLGEARGGVGYLARVTGAPVLPVGISGTFRLSFKDFFSGKRTIRVSYGKPICSAELFAVPNFTEVIDEKHAADLVMHEVGKLMKQPKPKQAQDTVPKGAML